MTSPAVASDKIVSILTIPCLQDCTTIIPCKDNDEKQQWLQEIAERVSALYADYFTQEGTQKLIDALVNTDHVDQKKREDFARIVKRDLTELDPTELNLFQDALKARILKTFEIEDEYCKDRCVRIRQKDICNEILGEAIQDTKLSQKYNRMYIAFFPFARRTEIEWKEDKRELKVMVITPKSNGYQTW